MSALSHICSKCWAYLAFVFPYIYTSNLVDGIWICHDFKLFSIDVIFGIVIFVRYLLFL